MAYSDGFRRLAAGLARRRAAGQARRQRPTLSLGFLRGLIAGQQTYVAWTAALILIQLAEIAILAVVHRVYFPPESLEVLRVLSALSLLGVIAAFGMRAMPSAAVGTAARGASARQRARILLVAQLLFLAMAVLAAAISAYVVAATTLHFTTPPIYRAVLLAGVVALPFDVFVTFMFYNLGRFPAVVLRRNYRALALAANLVALGCLWLGAPLPFLGFLLGPRVAVALTLWRQAARRPALGLFALTLARDRDDLRHALGFARRLAPAVAVQLAVDLTLLATFRGLGRADANLALLVFFCHKLIHVATVLGVKSNLAHQRDLDRSIRLGDRRGARRIAGRLLATVLAYAALTLALFPLVLLRRDVLFWASPIGDYLTVGTTLIAAMIALVVCRALTATTAAWIVGRAVAPARLLAAVAIVVAPAVTLLALTDRLLAAHELEPLFAAFLAVDLAANLLATAVLAPIVLGGAPRSDATTRQLPTQDFLARAARTPGGAIVVVSWWPRVRADVFDPFAPTSLHALLADPEAFTRWGPGATWLLVGRDLDDRLAALRARFAGALRDLRVVPVDGRAPLALLAAIAAGRRAPRTDAPRADTPAGAAPADAAAAGAAPADALAATLYLLAHARPGPLDAPPPALRTTLDALLATTTAAADPAALTATAAATDQLAADGLHVVTAATGWRVSAVADPDARLQLGAYLARIVTSGETLCPAAAPPAAMRGIVTLNRGTTLALVAYLIPSRRASLDALRALAFAHNLEQFRTTVAA